MNLIFEAWRALTHRPGVAARLMRRALTAARGAELCAHWPGSVPAGANRAAAPGPAEPVGNPLEEYFRAHREGPGIWKWEHYFEVYHRHCERFRGREVHLLEIGIYSGGSLGMWREYFGPGCKIYGVDIEPACRAYESDGIQVFLGDQADRNFWADFRKKVPRVDIVIDDGGHLPEQQIVTLEEVLPHLSAGGVYLCEDVHGTFNPFASYVHALGLHLNSAIADAENKACQTTAWQRSIGSIHLYPFLTVLEKRAQPLERMRAPKHGTQWQPFFDPKT